MRAARCECTWRHTCDRCWAEAAKCMACGDQLERPVGSGRPRKYCLKKACELEGNRRRRERSESKKEYSSRCPECGGLAAFPCPRGCAIRASL